VFHRQSNAKGSFVSPARAHLRLAMLPAWILAALAAPLAHAAAAPASGSVSFDADFFPAGMAPKVDLSRFEKANAALPGTYRGDVTLNKAWRARTDIVFANEPGSDEAYPCFDAGMLTRYGVDVGKLADDPLVQPSRPLPQGTFCGPLGDYIPGATTSFDPGEQSLSISVPQIYTLRSARGFVDPSQWDAGIGAAVVGYNANLYRSSGRGGGATSGYLGLNASMNFGSWHAVHQGSMNWRERGGFHYQDATTFLQHDIPSWRAQMAVGDTFTSGELFDSVRLRGVRLYADDRMLPDSMRGFAPIVRGIAESNARVMIRQRGYIIYDASVAPGPFAIDDLYPTGYGGDLDVEVIEADGRSKRFAVPFSAVPQLLRPGQTRWSVAAGKVRQLSLIDTPSVIQGTIQRGLSNHVTGYVGATVGTGYRSALLGAALNTDIGAFSADATQARNQTPGQPASQGLSLRVGYNKNIASTGTDFAVAAYRYSTAGYVGLNDAVVLRDAAARGYGDIVARQRSRMDISVNQTLGQRYGQLFVTGSARDYWGREGRQVDFTAGYSNQWKSLSYSFSAQRTRDSIDNTALFGGALVDRVSGAIGGPASRPQARRDTRLFLTVSLPLGQAAQAPSLTALLNRSRTDGTTSQVSVNGSAGADNRYHYGATVSRANGDNPWSLNGQYNGGFGNLSAGYSHGNGFRQFGAGMAGTVIAHRGGAVYSPPTGDTIGLVYAPDARGARVESGQGSVVDKNGYAVVPYLQPYQLNTVTLDPRGTDAGVELKETTQNVAPRAGSVVMLKYETSNGRALMIETTLPDGRPVPFGADVLDAVGNNVGVAGQASRLFVSDMQASGTLTVRWGAGATDACRIQVTLPPAAKGRQVERETIHATCEAEGVAMSPQIVPQTLQVAVLDAIGRYPGLYGSPSARDGHLAWSGPNHLPDLPLRAAG
jgi:outer membrane usher protein